jgi:hypothetical protein
MVSDLRLSLDPVVALVRKGKEKQNQRGKELLPLEVNFTAHMETSDYSPPTSHPMNQC